jgi:uncharacterized protein YdaU (DUF1376 family)
MAKPPAFQCYARDALTGGLTMSCEVFGAYWRCLLYEWDAGGVPASDLSELARVMGCSKPVARRLWSKIAKKFQQDSDGIWRNARLESLRKTDRFYVPLTHHAEEGTPKQAHFDDFHSDPQANPLVPASAICDLRSASTPKPPAARMARATLRPPSRREEQWATEWLRSWRASHWGQECPHDDPCANDLVCIGRLVQDRRRHVMIGQQRRA